MTPEESQVIVKATKIANVLRTRAAESDSFELDQAMTTISEMLTCSIREAQGHQMRVRRLEQDVQDAKRAYELAGQSYAREYFDTYNVILQRLFTAGQVYRTAIAQVQTLTGIIVEKYYGIQYAE